MKEDLHGARYDARDLSPGRRLALLMLLTALCFAGGKIGLLVPLVQQRMTLLWPPTGIALAAVLLCGAWVWPAAWTSPGWASPQSGGWRRSGFAPTGQPCC